MRRRFGDLEMPADLGEILALVEQLFALGEFPDHLLGRVMPLLHAVPLAPFWSIGTLIGTDSLTGVPTHPRCWGSRAPAPTTSGSYSAEMDTLTKSSPIFGDGVQLCSLCWESLGHCVLAPRSELQLVTSVESYWVDP